MLLSSVMQVRRTLADHKCAYLQDSCRGWSVILVLKLLRARSHKKRPCAAFKPLLSLCLLAHGQQDGQPLLMHNSSDVYTSM